MLNPIMTGSERADISYPQGGHLRYRQVEDDSFWFRHRNRCILAALERFPPPGRVYDVGGGNGFVARALLDAGLDTVLVEPGAVGAENARRLGVEVVINSTIEEADLANHSLPAIGIFDVLEHIEDDAGFLRTLQRFLTATGRLFVTVPAFPMLWSVEDEFAGHFRRYTAETLGTRLVASGFQVDYIGYFFSLLPLPIWLLRSLPSRLELRKEADLEKVQREHATNGSAFLQRALAWEAKAISMGRRIPIGSSVLCVVHPTAGGA